MDDWVDPRQPYRGRKSLYREQYNALGKRNLAAIEQIVTSKYQRGPAFNRQYPFVDILLSDIMQSAETLDASELVREPRRLPLSNECHVKWHKWLWTVSSQQITALFLRQCRRAGDNLHEFR